jgi:transposase
MSGDLETAEVDLEVVRGIIAKASEALDASEAKILSGLLDSHLEVLRLLREKGSTIQRLRRLFNLSKSERLAVVTNDSANGRSPAGPDSEGAPSPEEAEVADGVDEANTEAQHSEAPPKPKPRTREGGRRSASDYQGPETSVPHADLRAGDTCTACERGKLYPFRTVVHVVIRGQAPLQAKKFNLEVLRCNTCGETFTAEPPAEAKGPKYRASAVAILAALHYTFGMPFNRQEDLQKQLGVPVASSTQWKLMNESEPIVRPVYEALEQHAAASRTIHVDDTYLRLLHPSMGVVLRRQLEPVDPGRTGQFTTGMLAIDRMGNEVALIVTGQGHAGENLIRLMQQRPPTLPPPIIMSDALSRNTSGLAGVLAVYSAYCLAHARRGVVDEIENYPEEARHVLNELAEVFHHDKTARELELSGRARKNFHRKHSWSIIKRLKRWIHERFETRQVEPNSDMGKALKYIIKHWKKLTLFLRQPDAPLTNNACERLLKMAIRYRKNSYFYNSQRGAEVGDTFMALTYTANLNGKNPVHYLTSLLEHPEAVAANPKAWLPWNYEQTLAELQPTSTSANEDVPATATSVA